MDSCKYTHFVNSLMQHTLHKIGARLTVLQADEVRDT